MEGEKYNCCKGEKCAKNLRIIISRWNSHCCGVTWSDLLTTKRWKLNDKHGTLCMYTYFVYQRRWLLPDFAWTLWKDVYFCNIPIGRLSHLLGVDQRVGSQSVIVAIATCNVMCSCMWASCQRISGPLLSWGGGTQAAAERGRRAAREEEEERKRVQAAHFRAHVRGREAPGAGEVFRIP